MRSAEQLFSEMARMQLPPPELDIQKGAVYAKVTLRCGHFFNPVAIKFTNEPLDKTVAWEVSTKDFLTFSYSKNGIQLEMFLVYEQFCFA